MDLTSATQIALFTGWKDQVDAMVNLRLIIQNDVKRLILEKQVTAQEATNILVDAQNRYKEQIKNLDETFNQMVNLASSQIEEAKKLLNTKEI